MIGLRLKALAGHVFAVAAGSRGLQRASRAIGARQHVGDTVFDAVESFVLDETRMDDSSSLAAAVEALRAPATLDAQGAALMILAKAAASSPARVTDAVLQSANVLALDAIVEFVSWIGLLQALYRIESYYDE